MTVIPRRTAHASMAVSPMLKDAMNTWNESHGAVFDITTGRLTPQYLKAMEPYADAHVAKGHPPVVVFAKPEAGVWQLVLAHQPLLDALELGSALGTVTSAIRGGILPMVASCPQSRVISFYRFKTYPEVEAS